MAYNFNNSFLNPLIQKQQQQQQEAEGIVQNPGLLGSSLTLTDIGKALAGHTAGSSLLQDALGIQSGRQQQEANAAIEKYKLDQLAQQNALERQKEEYMQKVGLALPAQIAAASQIQTLNQANAGLQGVQQQAEKNTGIGRFLPDFLGGGNKKAAVESYLTSGALSGLNPDEPTVRGTSLGGLSENAKILKAQNELKAKQLSNQAKAYQKISGVNIPTPNIPSQTQAINQDAIQAELKRRGLI